MGNRISSYIFGLHDVQYGGKQKKGKGIHGSSCTGTILMDGQFTLFLNYHTFGQKSIQELKVCPLDALRNFSTMIFKSSPIILS